LVDKWGASFTLVVSADSALWQRAVESVRQKDIPLNIIDVSSEGEYEADDDKFIRLYEGDGSHSAVLVRPDGFVAARFAREKVSSTLLQQAFRQILGEGNLMKDQQKIAVEA
jgi:hypothetical protein